MPVLDLADAAAELLLGVKAILVAGGREVPDRNFIAYEEPALDCCDQLTVHANLAAPAAVGPQTPLARELSGMRVSLITFVVTLTRCVPQMDAQGNAPTAAAINGSAFGLYADAWTMWCGLDNAMRRKEPPLFAGPCRPRMLDEIRAVPEQGSCAGWRVEMRASLNDDPQLGIGP